MLTMRAATALLAALLQAATGSVAKHVDEIDDSCFDYRLSHVVEEGATVKAHLDLAEECKLYSPDVQHLKLLVEHQGNNRLHVLIEDRDEERYHVPSEIFTRPSSTPPSTASESTLEFKLAEASDKIDADRGPKGKKSSFGFQIIRRATGDVLFDTTGTSLIFERQFLRLKTWLPDKPNLYGLGEHSDPFRLETTDYIRTLWNRDSGRIPGGENLYGSHPIYFDHRKNGTHGVLLMNSNGMDVVVDQDKKGRQYLEYRAIGGVLDFYFLAGPGPRDVARQYADVISKPAMVPYWSLGFHQCKYGYRDWFEVAEVAYNYSQAEIPLEVMWTDIDYMDHRLIFTLDPGNFPIERMQDVVKYLHDRQQRYIMMVDPAVGKTDYLPYTKGAEMDVFMKRQNGSEFLGVVWPGVTVFPDWFHPNATAYWLGMFDRMFNPETGVDIDGVWIDMNEPASFCKFPCKNPWKQASDRGLPPKPPAVREPPRSIPGFPSKTGKQYDARDWLDSATTGLEAIQKPLEPSSERVHIDHKDDSLLHPPYRIHNHVGELGEQTMHPNLQHANGVWTYDAHNLYGALMSMVTRAAMLVRRPDKKPFIVTRSTFAGSGKAVAKWLGDNDSTWHHYRVSIRGMLGFTAIYQQPMVGSDVCGFLGDAKEKLCARWTTLGAFMPFFRNHADATSVNQEFYLWPLVADAARYAISWRYRLLDYFYTAMQRQSDDGTPAVSPLWFLHPQDKSTFAIDEQYYFGDCILVSPVMEEDSKTVMMYLPDDIFYELDTHEPVRGHGEWVTQHDVPYDRIPLHIRGGCVIPLRTESANTTTELRKKGFELIVAPGLDGKAQGSLYVDDGESLDGGDVKTLVEWVFEHGELRTLAADGMATPEEAGIKVDKVTVLGEDKRVGQEDINEL